jgi:glutaredoxin
MKTITFYHSVVCPRCHMAGRSLQQLLPKFPGIKIEKVEFLKNSKRLRRDGVTTIPTLSTGESRLAGFYLTKKRIREFLESVAGPGCVP